MNKEHLFRVRILIFFAFILGLSLGVLLSTAERTDKITEHIVDKHNFISFTSYLQRNETLFSFNENLCFEINSDLENRRFFVCQGETK